MSDVRVLATDLPFAQRLAEEMKDDHAVVALEVVGPYTLHLTFDDGKQATIDFEPALRQVYTGALYAPLLDPEYFARVTVDEAGILTWPNGMDFRRAYIYDWGKWVEPLLEGESSATS